MRNRSHVVKVQDCLIGFGCDDQINKSDALRFQIESGRACDPNHPWCGSPTHCETARRQWEKCWDDEALDFTNTFPQWSLPACVPNLTAREVLPKFPSYKVVAAKLTDIGGILSFNPSKLEQWRRRYGIPARTTVLLHQESLDALQDKLAPLVEDGRLFELARSLGSNIVFEAPGYSVYDDGSMCPVKQVANLRTSLLHAAMANRAGFDSIPTLGWNQNRPRDIEFISSWLKRQEGKITALAVNAQTGTHSNQLVEELAKGILEIERQAGIEYHWVVFGGRKRIETLVQSIPRNRITQVSRPKDFQVPLVAKDGSVSVQYLFDLRTTDKWERGRVSSNK